MVHVVSRIEEAAAGDGQADELTRRAGVVGVLELDARRGSDQIPHAPVGFEEEFLERSGPRNRRALHQPYGTRPGPGHEVHGGGEKVGVRPVGIAERKETQAHGGAAVEIELDCNGLPFDQASQSTQLVEHAFEHRGQLRRLV
jgi:hypothetical protein